MGADFKVKVLDEARAAEFKAMFGKDEVCVMSPVPTLMKVGDAEKMAYLLDIEMLSGEQLDTMVAFIARKFNLSQTFVMQNIAQAGVPVLADMTLVTVLNPMKWFGDDAIDEIDEPFGLFDDIEPDPNEITDIDEMERQSYIRRNNRG